MENPLQYVGLKDLTIDEQEAVQKQAQEHHTKLQKFMPKLLSMTVHVKAHEKAGNRKQYEVHLRLDIPGVGLIDSCKSQDWELAKAMHRSYEELEHQLEHRIKK